jgi:2-C-methyl-D-erythritol 4-phosphate cytidylyltransferase
MTDRIMIVVGAGRSSRFGTDKLMTTIAGLPLIAHTVAAVVDHVDEVIVVCRDDQIAALAELGLEAVLVPGGPSRTASERAGLAALGDPALLIGIHDGARPLVPPQLIETLYTTAADRGGAIPLTSPSFPLIHKTDLSVVEGASFAQTPQVFQGKPLLSAYVKAARNEYEGQDTAEIAQKFSDMEIIGVPGDPANIKVTFPEDLELVRALLEVSRSEPR